MQGVLYSHRANFLHAFTVAMPDASCMTAATSVLAVVPAFHANCWGLLFTAPLVGAKLVMPGLSCSFTISLESLFVKLGSVLSNKPQG